MEILVKRLHYTKHSTISNVYFDGKLVCNLLEDVVRSPGVKVQDQTAIPAGRYRLIINVSPRFQRRLPRLLDVPGFSGILWHTGNSNRDSSGCGIVGIYDPATPDWVSSSRVTFARIFERLEAAVAAGEVWVTYQNAPRG